MSIYYELAKVPISEITVFDFTLYGMPKWVIGHPCAKGRTESCETR